MWNTNRIVPLLSVFIFIKSGLQDDSYNDEDLQSSDVRRFWGIQDVVVSVGKLLHYKIPHDAFKGTILYYEVEGEEKHPLPKWMIFDKKSATLEGVPSVDDVGDTQINVKAYDNKGRYVNDMFLVQVYPLLQKNTNNKRKCKKGEEVMMITVFVEKNLNDISPLDKIAVLKNLSHYLHIPINTILFLPQKLNADVTGDSLTDNYNDAKYPVGSSILTWQIGCNERIWAEQLGVVEMLKKYVLNGTLSEVLRLPITYWRIVSSFNPFRIRRQVSNETEKLNVGITSNIDENDGDDNDDNDDDEADGDENELEEQLSQDTSTAVLRGLYPTPVIENNSFSSFISSEKPVIETKIFNQTSAGENYEEDSTDFPDSDTGNYNESFILTPELPEFNSTTIIKTPITNLSTDVEKITIVTPKRYPPRVKQNLEPMQIKAGQPYKKRIPENIFVDDEDGNTRNLSLKLIISDVCTPYTSWIELHPEDQELYILASLDTISRHEFTIEAVDSDGMSANNSLIIDVQYPQNARKINFEISLYMKLAENQKLSVALQFRVLDYLAKLYGDSDPSKITVRNVSCDPFVLKFTNNTLPLDRCDNTTISNLLNVLTDTSWSMDVNLNVQQVFGTEIIVEKVTWLGMGLCENIPSSRLPQPPKQNFKPVVRNRIDNITARVGELKIFKVPEDTFYDAEEPNPRNLKLTLLTENLLPLSADNWLQFDSTNQEFYGLPMPADVGTVKYQLVCNDNEYESEEYKARHVIEAVVEPAAKTFYSVEFVMKLIANYDEFRKTPSMQRNLIEKIAYLFGDRNTSNIVVGGFERGSIIVTWYNKSLPINDCPESDLYLQLRKIILGENYELNERVNKAFAPDFEAVSVQMSPIGICEGNLTEFHPLPPEVNTFQEKHAIYIPGEYFINYILPIAIIVTMIILAGLIACFLYRRQRSNKWTLNDEDERRTFRNKGIPVIFQDELEERVEPTNKSPIIMKEEKPPLPPPDYQKTLPPMASTALLSDFDDSSYQQGNVTFTRNSAERNGRSKQTPIYRKPPPYIPP